MIKSDNISYWVSQGYELAWKDYLSNDQFLPSLQDTLARAAKRKSSLRDFEISEAFLEFWKNLSKKISEDALKTLSLGPVAVLSLISDFSKCQHDEFLRIRCCIIVIENLYLSDEAKKGWKEKILSQINTWDPNFKELDMTKEKALIIAEFATFHLVKSSSLLTRKPLLDVICWDPEDEAYANSVQNALQLQMQDLKFPFFEEKPLNGVHIISGGIAAALQKQEKSAQYFELVQKYLMRLPPVPAEDPIDPMRYKELFEFILKNDHDEKVKEVALKGLESSQPAEYTLEITKLDLTGCQLETLPESIALLKELAYLDLCTNHLETVPECIKKLTQLKVLDLRGNKLAKLPPFLTKMYRLNRLELLENPIREVPSSLHKKVWELPYSARWSKGS